MYLQIKLVNINASDIVDGRPPVILGLIWTIILYFQIEENTKQMYAGSDSQNQFSSVAGGLVAQPMCPFQLHNIATSWLHLSSWNLPDFQPS